MKYFIIVCGFVTLMTGCAFTPQKATIAPSAAVTSSSIGKGITIAVKVVDERPTQSLGRRGTTYGPAAEITAAQDVAAAVKIEIERGLKAKGFTPSPDDPNQPVRLTVEVRLLQYSTSTGFWTGGVHVETALKAIAIAEGKVYEKMYRNADENRVIVVPTASQNEDLINKALSKVLSDLLEDPALLKVLAKSS